MVPPPMPNTAAAPNPPFRKVRRVINVLSMLFIKCYVLVVADVENQPNRYKVTKVFLNMTDFGENN
jgi:hypothetical protein